VSDEKNPIRYSEARALEDVTLWQGGVPTRIFAILLPVWRVEIRATVTQGEDYALIDRFLERGIALAGLDTPAALADFLGLDEVVVDRALRFLAAIGHLARQDERLTLTDLGQRSVRDDKRYIVTHQDRRVLYFDAFGSRPLTSPYYDAAVTLLSPGQAQAVAAAGEWPRFRVLTSTHGFRPEALAELARHSERQKFNLPERLDELEVLGAAEHAFLPMYLVRATQPGQRVRLFAYTQAGDSADLDVSELCEQTPEISWLIENEEVSAPAFPESAARWLDGLKLGSYRPGRMPGGVWRATLPGSAFGPGAALSLVTVGSFVVRGRDILNVWCEDVAVRRRTLLERVDFYLSYRTSPDRVSTEALVGQLARLLDLGAVGLPELRQMAIDAGKGGLAAQLASLG
jgi:hypothetical protein